MDIDTIIFFTVMILSCVGYIIMILRTANMEFIKIEINTGYADLDLLNKSAKKFRSIK